jgi:hypothetical protein
MLLTIFKASNPCWGKSPKHSTKPPKNSIGQLTIYKNELSQ